MKNWKVLGRKRCGLIEVFARGGTEETHGIPQNSLCPGRNSNRVLQNACKFGLFHSLHKFMQPVSAVSLRRRFYEPVDFNMCHSIWTLQRTDSFSLDSTGFSRWHITLWTSLTVRYSKN
jgi:hypothetical protein